MITNVSYDKFNTQFQTTEFVFGVAPSETKFKVQIIEEDDGSGTMIKKLKLTGIDDVGTEISNTFTRDESLELVSVIKSMINQIPTA